MRIPLVDQVISLVKKPGTAKTRRGAAAAIPREERVRAALAMAPVGIGVCTLDGHWLFVNDRFRELAGYGREELARLSFNGITHPDDAKKELPLMKRLVNGDLDSYRLEKRLMGKSGKYRNVEVLTALARDAGVLIYIVDEPQPQGAPRRSEPERMFAAVIDQLVDVAVIRMDDRGVITGWNAGAQRIFGHTRDEIIGKNRRTLYRDADSWEGKSTAVLQGAAAQRLEMEDWRVTKDGAHLWIRSTLSPFRPDGMLRGYIETITSAAEKKAPDQTPLIEQLRADVQKKQRVELSLRELIDDLRRTSEETMNELRIMTGALRGEIDRRKAAEDELRRANERLAAVPDPVAIEEEEEEEEVLAAPPPTREWRPLADTRVIGILREHAFHARSGTLFVQNGRKEKEIFFEEGKIFSCASNDPEKFLTHRLLTSGAITPEQRMIANEIKEASQLALGRILMILGAINEEQLVAEMRTKLQDEIAELLTWDDGQYVFVEGDVPSLQLVPLRIDVESVIEPPVTYVASVKSGKVHQLTCAHARRLTGAARVEVTKTDGYERCRICFAR
jgi:PAS domain S-box-containing protein